MVTCGAFVLLLSSALCKFRLLKLKVFGALKFCFALNDTRSLMKPVFLNVVTNDYFYY